MLIKNMKNSKRGMAWKLPEWIIALIVLALILFVIGAILYPKGIGAIDFIKNLFKFGR